MDIIVVNDCKIIEMINSIFNVILNFKINIYLNMKNYNIKKRFFKLVMCMFFMFVMVSFLRKFKFNGCMR